MWVSMETQSLKGSGWEEGPQGLQPPGCPCSPDADDKWVCVLETEAAGWGHRSPSPGSHTAVPPGATTHPPPSRDPIRRGSRASFRHPLRDYPGATAATSSPKDIWRVPPSVHTAPQHQHTPALASSCTHASVPEGVQTHEGLHPGIPDPSQYPTLAPRHVRN